MTPSVKLDCLYSDTEAAKERFKRLKSEFEGHFGKSPELLFSAPGRTEIGGNHTDHENGLVLCGSVDLDMTAYVSQNGGKTVRLYSEQFEPVIIDLGDLSKKKSEIGRSESLVRGVAHCLKERGFDIFGFDGMMTSNIPAGMGLSSSAAFEILIGNIFNVLFCGGALSPVELAKIGQFAEKEYFGKPCGLMDQIGCSVGGCVFVDFENPNEPKLESFAPDFDSAGIVPCIIKTHAGHGDLTDEYAAITEELCEISAHFSSDRLRGVSKEDFYKSISVLRKNFGDRAVLRAMHIFDENKRVKEEFAAIKRKDFESFLSLANSSGLSSQTLLQNVHSEKNPKNQVATFTIALCKRLLGQSGAVRIHGGGFGGTVQAFVPHSDFDLFRSEIDRVLGENSCRKISVRSVGGCTVEL